MNTELTPIIEAILRAVTVDEMYQWTYTHDDKKYQMLQINLPANASIRFDKTRRVIKKAIGNQADLYFNIHFTHHIQKKINQGLGRTYLICQPQNRIYQNPAQEYALVLPSDSVEAIIEKTRSYIDKEKAKIRSFIDGYSFYLYHKNHAHAAFMLHQAIELSLRTAENLLISDDKKSHSLRCNINYLKAVDSKLGCLAETQTEKKALKKIDEAYINYRYNQDYIIDENQLEIAYQIAANALNWLNDYTPILCTEISAQLTPDKKQNNKMEKHKKDIDIYNKAYCNTNYRDLILNALEFYCTPAVVVCFGYDSDHHKYHNVLQQCKQDRITHAYYLFVAYDSLSAELNTLAQLVNDVLPEHVSVTLLLEATPYFAKKLAKGHPFFLSLMKVGDIWFQHTTAIRDIELESIVTPQLDLDYAQQQWENRYNNACSLYYAFEDHVPRRPEPVYYTISQVLEQTCLGVINVVLQYKPQSVGLPLLMNLCRLIVPDAHASFCLDNQDHKSMFKKIIKAQQKFRHDANFKADSHALSSMQEMTKLFIQRCNAEMESYFEKIVHREKISALE